LVLFLAALRVTPAVESLLEPIGITFMLNCSSSEGGVVTWSVRLPNEDVDRSSMDLVTPLPPNIIAVDGPGFSELHITGTLGTNGSIFTCLTLIGGSLQSSDSITAVFYG
jgi:hypothetical protein